MFYGISAAVTALLLYMLECHVTWQRRSHYLKDQLNAARPGILHHSLDFSQLDGIPETAKRYLLHSTSERKVKSLSFQQQGWFKLQDNWHRFEASEFITTEPAGFLWDATIHTTIGNSVSFAELPATLSIPVHVRDSLFQNHGGLEARIYQTVPLFNMTQAPEIDKGELLRWVAESALVPTALFPSEHLSWEDGLAHNESILQYHNHRLTVTFRDKVIHSIAGHRPRRTDHAFVDTPFEGHFGDYQRHEGMLVPEYMEIGWYENNTLNVYFKAMASNFDYDFY